MGRVIKRRMDRLYKEKDWKGKLKRRMGRVYKEKGEEGI